MSLSPDAIDRIVANVLSQLSTPRVPASPSVPPAQSAVLPPVPTSTAGSVSLNEVVITAEILERVPVGSTVQVQQKAIVTPAAWDSAKLRRLRIERTENTRQAEEPKGSAQPTGARPLLIVVRSSPAVDQLWAGISGRWQREMFGCPDDAAKHAIAELSRGGASQIVILADQTYQAAALANRHEKVKSAPIQGAGDVRLVRQQLRANVWCVSPAGRSFYELRNLIQQIEQLK